MSDRDELFARQRAERGWDDGDTFSLDCTVAKFMLPRLQRYRELTNGFSHPMHLSGEEWDTILAKIEFSLTRTITDMEGSVVPKEEWDAWREGYTLLGTWFTNLWW